MHAGVLAADQRQLNQIFVPADLSGNVPGEFIDTSTGQTYILQSGPGAIVPSVPSESPSTSPPAGMIFTLGLITLRVH